MRKLIVALALTTAVCMSSAAVAFADGGPPPTQAAIQSASTSQAAGAASGAVQSDPTNTNISIRILSPGNDGSVSQSNAANSSANAGNSASTSQSATQSQPGSGVQSAIQSAGTDQLAAALSEAKQYGASNTNIPVRILSPGDGGSVTQSNAVDSSANAGNDARTRQTSTQSQGSSCGCSGAPGVQSGTQTANTSQGALAASKAVQVDPSNTNISVRILSPGNDGDVTQSNSVTSDANAGNRASTEQRASQGKAGESCGCEAAATTPAVTQPDAATQSDATASQPVSTAGQADSAAKPASSPSIGVQAAGQDAATHQIAAAGSSAEQSGASNANYPVRIGSPGDDGSVDQSNAVSSKANAGNSAWTGQSANQSSGGKSCGCNSGNRHPGISPEGGDGSGLAGTVEGDPAVRLWLPRDLAVRVWRHPALRLWLGRRLGQHELAGAHLEPGDRREPDAVEHRRFVGERGQPRRDQAGRHAAVWWRQLAAGPGRRPGSRHRTGCGGRFAHRPGQPVERRSAGPGGKPGRRRFGRAVERRLVGGPLGQRRLDVPDW